MRWSRSGRKAVVPHVGATPWLESGHEVGHITVARWDDDATSWVSKRAGGEAVGRRGFIQPDEHMFRNYRVDPYSVTTSLPHEHNLITTGGWDRILNLAIGTGTGGGNASWVSGTCRMWVGTGTAAASSGDVNLSAAASGTAARWGNMVTGAGIVGTGTGYRRLSFTSTFGTGDANFAWAEWAIDQGTAGSATGAPTTPLLNHAISAQGTKASGQTWTATAQLDFS